MDKNTFSIFSFFISLQTEYGFYRPLSRETFNFLIYSLFGLNSLIFHLINFTLILINGFLGFLFVKKLVKDQGTAFLFTIIFFFSSIHAIELYYLSSIQTLLSTLFILIGLLSYQRFREEKIWRLWIVSWICFIPALWSHESAVVYVLLVVLLELFYNHIRINNFKENVLKLAPFFLILTLRIILHFFEIFVPSDNIYLPNFAPLNIMNSFVWYVLWSFGLPEMLTDFVTLRFSINPNFLKYYSDYAIIVFPTFGFILLSFIFLTYKFGKKIVKNKVYLFFFSSFIFSLIPFLFFPQHKFVYYLSLPFIWFSAMVATMLSFTWKSNLKFKTLCLLIIFGYMIINNEGLRINQQTHWAAKRANSAKQIINDIKRKYPILQKGTIFFIKNDPSYPFIAKEWGGSSKQAFYILSGSDAFQLLYKDPTIQVYFEDISELPKNINKNKVIVYVARFPY